MRLSCGVDLTASPFQSRPWIKVCGTKTCGELEVCAASGATHVGLNAWPGSPRHVPPAQVRVLIRAARNLGLAPVLVAPPGLLCAGTSVVEAGASFIQLIEHPPAPLRRRLVEDGTGLIEVRRVTTSLDGALPWGDVLLLDAFSENKPGGTGQSFPWALARRVPRPFILAGGLSPDNVAQAIQETAAWGVDAASGLECRPGVKDPARIRDFCAAARSAFEATRRSAANGPME